MNTEPGALATSDPPELAQRQPFVRTDQRDGYVAIWLEPREGDECLGLCIGTGGDLRAALLDAQGNLADVAQQLDHLMRTA